jgi:hypothetical protein
MRQKSGPGYYVLTNRPTQRGYGGTRSGRFGGAAAISMRRGEALLQESEDGELPANFYYGDGSPIESEGLDQLRAAYHAETVSFPWQKGDLLMLDNMLVAHGRAPFSGLTVAMSSLRAASRRWMPISSSTTVSQGLGTGERPVAGLPYAYCQATGSGAVRGLPGKVGFGGRSCGSTRTAPGLLIPGSTLATYPVRCQSLFSPLRIRYYLYILSYSILARWMGGKLQTILLAVCTLFHEEVTL